jgi:hypothetical protein
MSWRLLLLLLLVQPVALRAQEAAPANAESAIRALEEQERIAVLNEDLAALEHSGPTSDGQQLRTQYHPTELRCSTWCVAV